MLKQIRLIILILIFNLFICGCEKEDNSKIEKINSLINYQIHLGMKKTHVIKILKTNEFEFSLLEDGINEIVVMVRDVKKSVFINEGIQIRFIFDRDDMLEKYALKRVYLGL